ncbi:glycosyltransferase [Bacillus sp. H8-1]|nr:glycosyltransferase [Bacillus sp. H8-1]
MDNEYSKLKVSVIIPTYKRTTFFLERAIKSVLNQTYKNIEIIVIDDNALPELVQFRREATKLMESFKSFPVKYIQNKENLGGSLSRNVGIENSTGSYITFLDDDDRYLPDKVQNQLKFMCSGNYDVTFTDLKLCNNKEKTVDYREYSNINSYSNDNLLKYHIMRHITGTPTFMYKRNILINIGSFPNVKMGQEYHLMLKTIESGAKIGYFPKSDVVAYRHESGGISMGANKIIGELELYKFKQKYFYKLTYREKMFVKFRHYAVMTVGYKRNKKYIKMFVSLLKACISSPIDVSMESTKFFVRVIKNS